MSSEQEQNQPRLEEEEKRGPPIQNISELAAVEAAKQQFAEEEAVAATAVASDGTSIATEALESTDADIDLNLVLELGDRVVIKSDRYGEVVGTIYYRSGDLIRVLPDGLSNTLINFPRTEDDEFDPELGVTESIILKKHIHDEFIKQQDFRVGQRVQGIDEKGEKGALYTIIGLDEAEDSIILQEEDDNVNVPVEFSGVGIPEDAPFVILRIVGLVEKQQQQQQQPGAELLIDEKEAAIRASEQEQGQEEEQEAGEDEEYQIDVIGQVVIPVYASLKEIKTSRQTIPDALQKVDAINDFINIYEPRLQKDPRILRENRIRVETLYKMKQLITAYNEDGTVKGLKSVSATTILELLNRTRVPLSRPVLDIRKRVYQDTDEEPLVAWHEPTLRGGQTEVYTKIFYDELKEINANLTPTVSSIIIGDTGKHVAHYIQEQNKYIEFERPWLDVDPASSDHRVIARSDMPFFRTILPDIESRTLDGLIPGVATGSDKNGCVLDYVYYGTEQALATTYRKGGKTEETKQVLLSAEGGRLLFHLLFPQSVADALGSSRTGLLALDSGRSLMQIQTLFDILKKLEGVQEVATPQTIIALGITGNTMGNISLAKLIAGMDIPALGLGDTFTSLADLGMEQLELTPDIITALQSKIDAYQTQLINTIATLRKALEERGPETLPTPNPMLPMTNPILSELPRSEPTLVEDLKEFEAYSPTLVSSDIATFSYLLRKHGDLLQAILGQVPLFVAKERNAAVRQRHIDLIMIEQQLILNKVERGEPPHPNLCEHMAVLRGIRRLEDETDRMTLLTKIIAKYQGKRNENWIDCNICKQHLVCMHERLQVQAFLNPSENETIQKEIVLKFAGGMFQGHYICRNCGQPIQEIAYDTNLQFDDEGRPMSGRAVLEDTSVLKEEELDQIIAIPLNTETIPTFTTKTETQYYKILRELSERVGIALEEAKVRKCITRMDIFVSSLPTRKAFAEQEAERKAAAAAANKKFTARNYDRILSRNTICCAGAYLFVDIQTAIPDYKIHSSLPGLPIGVTPGFGGFPLDENTANKQGLIYMAYAIASVTRKEAPWTTSGFQEEGVRETRVASIQKLMEDILVNVMGRSPSIKQEIVIKNQYVKELTGSNNGDSNITVGTTVKARDKIPVNFLPDMTMPTKAEAAASAEGALVPEAASSSPRLVAKAWIRQGNQLAREFSKPSRQSFIPEITCCDINVRDPGSFWTTHSVPSLPIRQMKPYIRVRSQQVSFSPRPKEDLESDSLALLQGHAYELYLKVCHQGPQRGMPHEPGLTHKCHLCGFQFPTHPKILDHDEGKIAVESQGIVTTLDAFEPLLDTVRTLNNVPTVPIAIPTPWDDTLVALASLEPQPFEENQWNRTLMETFTELKRIASSSEDATLNQGDLAITNSALSDLVSAAEVAIFPRFKGVMSSPQITQANLAAIAALPWTNFVQILETYFIVPFQKIITRFDKTQIQLNKGLTKNFAQDHVDALNKIMAVDNTIVNHFQPRLANSGYAVAKLSRFIQQLRAITAFKNRLRAKYFIGGDVTFQYIQQGMIYGPIAELLDSSVVPEGIQESVVVVSDKSPETIIQLVGMTINNFKKQQLSYNDDQLRLLIQARNETEAMGIVTKFMALSEEERAMDSMNRRKGLGRWAVGGTSVIFKYDADYWVRERAENEAAGIDENVYGLNPEEQLERAEGGYDVGDGNDEFAGEEGYGGGEDS